MRFAISATTSVSAALSTFVSFLRATKVTPSGHFAPSLIHVLSVSASAFVRRALDPFLISADGGMSLSSSSASWVVVYTLLFVASPGTIRFPRMASALVWSRGASFFSTSVDFGLWQRTQLNSRIGCTSFTKSTAAVASVGTAIIMARMAGVVRFMSVEWVSAGGFMPVLFLGIKKGRTACPSDAGGSTPFHGGIRFSLNLNPHPNSPRGLFTRATED